MTTGSLSTVHVNGRRIHAAITDNCVVLTVIDYPPCEIPNPLLGTLTEGELAELGQSLMVKRSGGIDVKEHNCFTDAIKYLADQPEVMTGDWDRIYIINPERIKYKEDRKHGRIR